MVGTGNIKRMICKFGLRLLWIILLIFGNCRI